MPKVVVDWDRCQNYGHCVVEAPTVFRFSARDTLDHDSEVRPDARPGVEAAADFCPMQAISLID